jgi:hypothetical protein
MSNWSDFTDFMTVEPVAVVTQEPVATSTEEEIKNATPTALKKKKKQTSISESFKVKEGLKTEDEAIVQEPPHVQTNGLQQHKQLGEEVMPDNWKEFLETMQEVIKVTRFVIPDKKIRGDKKLRVAKQKKTKTSIKFFILSNQLERKIEDCKKAYIISMEEATQLHAIVMQKVSDIATSGKLSTTADSTLKELMTIMRTLEKQEGVVLEQRREKSQKGKKERKEQRIK